MGPPIGRRQPRHRLSPLSPPSAAADWLGVMSPQPPLGAHWAAQLPVREGRTQGAVAAILEQSAGPGGAEGAQRLPLPPPSAMAAPLGTGVREEETEQEKQDTQEKETLSPERAEEAKLKAKYPTLAQKPGGSDFLMKRLQKGQKYFDSGDYNMAKAKMKNKQLPSAGPDKNLVTGDHIPTPQDLPQRKPSLLTSKLAG